MKLEFSRKIFEKYQILNFIDTRPLEPKLFYAERHRDMTKLIAPFRNFANKHKTYLCGKIRDLFFCYWTMLFDIPRYFNLVIYSYLWCCCGP